MRRFSERRTRCDLCGGVERSLAFVRGSAQLARVAAASASSRPLCSARGCNNRVEARLGLVLPHGRRPETSLFFLTLGSMRWLRLPSGFCKCPSPSKRVGSARVARGPNSGGKSRPATSRQPSPPSGEPRGGSSPPFERPRMSLTCQVACQFAGRACRQEREHTETPP